MKKKFLSLFFVSTLILSACGGDTDTTEDDSATPDDIEEVEEVEKAEDAEVIEEKAEDAEETEDDVSQEFKNALSKGQSYAEQQYMSKASVYNQLVSEYGENFPEDAAEYAIENIDADWKANALEKGRSYYEDQSMSKDGVYDQLTSEYGEGFTEEEAQYAIDNLD